MADDDESLLQVIYLARELRDSRIAAAAAAANTTTTNVATTKSTGFLVAMGEEPAPRPTYRGRVISLAAMRSLSDAPPNSTICAQCAPFLAALAAQGGAALAGYVCTHGGSSRGGGGGRGNGVGGGGGGGGGARPVPGAQLPRLDTADGFWSLGNAELASLPLPAAPPLPP